MSEYWNPSATTGSASSWNPTATGSTLAGLDTEGTHVAATAATVYVTGSFTAIGGGAQTGFAALNTATGAATAWSSGLPSSVNALALSGSTLYVGGGFTMIGGQSRSNLAALNADTGAVAAWNHSLNGGVFAIGVQGSTVYVGGLFTTVAGQPRHDAAAIDAATGNATSWDPNPDDIVAAIAHRGDDLAPIAQVDDRDSRNRIEIAASLVVPNVDAIAPFEHGICPRWVKRVQVTEWGNQAPLDPCIQSCGDERRQWCEAVARPCRRARENPSRTTCCDTDEADGSARVCRPGQRTPEPPDRKAHKEAPSQRWSRSASVASTTMAALGSTASSRRALKGTGMSGMVTRLALTGPARSAARLITSDA